MGSDDTTDAPTPAPLTFLGLPREVQKDIFSHCSQGDLICLSLVSHHFRDLAAAQLYRSFHIVFPDEDDPAFDSPIDGLAGGLDTFVTSDYDYGKHLKDISLDTLSGGDKAEAAYKPYLFNVSCGKFMNTLLLLALRKATTLESFTWNIRVELSRPVYKALHQIDTLRNVHIRLQAGPSLYEAPPPLPFSSSQALIPSASSAHPPPPPPPPPPTLPFTVPMPIPGGPSLFYTPTTNTHSPPVPKPIVRAKAPRRPPMSNEPPTLSGFKKLVSLSVLDIDGLEVVPEIKACVQDSAGSLTKLKLSFSESLALQARKPPPDIDPEESDPDDEFQVGPVPPTGGYHDDVSAPAKAFRAQEERRNQEAVLGSIFDLETPAVKRPHKKAREKEEKETKDEPSADPARDFLNAIKALSNKLMKDLNGSGDFSTSQQDILDTIETAARKYVESEEKKTPGDEQQDPKEESSSGLAETKGVEQAVDDANGPTQSSLFEPKTTKPKESDGDLNPEDIDIEEPEEQFMIESQDSAPTKEASATDPPTPASEPSSKESSSANGTSGTAPPPVFAKAVANLTAHRAEFLHIAERLEALGSGARPDDYEVQALGLVEDAKRELSSFSTDIDRLKNQIRLLEVAGGPPPEILAAQTQAQRIGQYLKATRGVALRSLSIYLIPVKASVLSRAVDLRVLERLTLLNVGPQAPIWAHLQKENKESPLALRKVFTDNLSVQCLTFLSELEELHEFFAIERDNKYKPESFAPKTAVTMSQIRHLVLKKHIASLERLMIKNMANNSWDADEKAIMLICRRGKRLQELAFSMGIRTIHTFMQQLSGLARLRALHIVQLRNDDTCVWVMRETKRFLIDNLSHYPEMKLEWISVDEDERVERIMRPADLPKKDRAERADKKTKGAHQAATTAGGIGTDLFPVLPALDSWDLSSDSEDDEDLQGSKIETLENIHFYDVWGVRIFKKEIVTGRL